MTPSEQLRAAVEAERWHPDERKIMGLAYDGPADFVLSHGEDFRVTRYPFGVPGAQQKCYGNAIVVSAMLDLPYVEGYALAPHGEAIHHAWNALDLPDGSVALLDATWANTGLAYLGVRFSLERADDATWNGDATVLDDSHRGWPILRERWEGEDASLEYPPSPILSALRTRDPNAVYAALEALSLAS